MKERTKKLCIGVLATGLILTLSVGGTLAFMTRATEDRVNNFSFADPNAALNAILTEPDWDGIIDYEYAADGSIANVIYGYTEVAGESKAIYGYTDGDRSRPITDPTATGRGVKATSDSTDETFKPVYGVDLAQNMIPGQAAPKNPIITNTGSLTDEWVAAKVTFVYGSGSEKAGQPLELNDMQSFNDVVSVDWNLGSDADDWERVEGEATDISQVFYYQGILKKGAEGAHGDVSTAIFNSVTVSEDATNAQIATLNSMGGVAIYIEGFAVQSDVGETYSAFKAWGFGEDAEAGNDNDNVVFAGTPTASAPADLTPPGIIAKN